MALFHSQTRRHMIKCIMPPGAYADVRSVIVDLLFNVLPIVCGCSVCLCFVNNYFVRIVDMLSAKS